MAVEHMVWIRFHDGVGERRIAEHIANLAALTERVDVIDKLAIGANFTDRADGCTHGMIVTLKDREALSAYRDHPHHVSVATALKKDADLLAMDIEH